MWFDVCGILSATPSMKTVKDSMTVILSETFSPASGGIRNTITVSADSMKQGTMAYIT